MRILTAWSIVLLLGILGCSGNTSSSGSSGLKEPDDPQADAARALPAGQAHIELTRSQPAGADGEQAEYEWTVLTRVVLDDLAVPPGVTVQKPTGLGWAVARLTLRAGFDKRHNDLTFGPQGELLPKPGRRHFGLDGKYQCVSFLPGLLSGKSETGGRAPPGSGLILKRNAWPNPALEGLSAALSGRKASLEMDRAPIDDLVKPLLKAPQTFDLPKTLDLLQIGEQTTRLEIVR